MSEKRDAQREVTRIALSGIAGFGFALAGSGAIREHGSRYIHPLRKTERLCSGSGYFCFGNPQFPQ